MNITLQKNQCISCGTCAALAPTVFSIQTGVVSLIKDPKDLTPEEQNQVRQAAQMCPSGVIEVTD